MALLAVLLTNCQKEESALKKPMPTKAVVQIECITFDNPNLAAGTITNQLYTDANSGPIGVVGRNPNFPGVNAAMIFDSDNPYSGDLDLGTPNEDFGGPGVGVGGDMGSPHENNTSLGKFLIVSEDLNPNQPNDLRGMGEFDLDFSAIGPVTVHSMTIVDVEGKEGAPIVNFYDGGNSLISSVALTTVGDNGVENVSFGAVSGVVKMEIHLGGSGAVDNICIELPQTPPPPPGPGCTRTIGFWKNHAGFGPQTDVLSQYLSQNLGTAGGAKTINVTTNTIARDILTQKVYGKPNNGITKLYAQLLAAKLNIAAAADGTPVNTVIANADAFLANHDWNDWKSLSKNMQKTINGWKDALDNYNNGNSGVAHCK